jgi:glycogen(starch) synthase
VIDARVLIVSWEYPPIVEGGLARHVRKLAEGLADAGADVCVLTRGAGDTPVEEERGGVRVRRVLHTRAPRDLDAFLAWVDRMNDDLAARGRELLDERSFDVVHGHDWLVAEAACALARAAGVPYVTTIHATEHGRHQGWVAEHPQSHIHGVETWMAHAADHVIACSHYMRAHVADVFGLPDARIAVIPNGIDPGDLRPVGDLARLRRRFAEPGERLVLLAGRLVYEKGFQDALDALRALTRRRDDVRFVVAGSGPHEAALREQAQRLGIAPRGAFLGWIGDDLLHSLYRVADVCIVPSIYEPFGLVALEAMASGCACLAADVGGLREVVPHRDAGLRFRARSPRSLSHWLGRVLDDDELRRALVAEAREHVRAFDWADVARRTAGVYGQLVAARAPAA